MSRRTTALTVAIMCLVALFAVAFIAPMPYVLLSPGPTENTLGAFDGKAVITIDGHRTYPTTGELRLTTVSETRADYTIRLPQVLGAWLSSEQIVVPRDVIYPPDQSVQQVQQQNQQQMLDSQQTAVIAGLGQAGIDAVAVTITKVKPGPARGVLQQGDQITSVNGTHMDRTSAVVSAISSLPVSSPVRVGYVRGGKEHQATIRTKANPDNPSSSLIGIQIADIYDAPFDVSINLGERIGGPSAGLIFSLAIYDKITPGSLTGSRIIAGTGSIDEDGNVGAIGGIQQKIVGAYDDGARVFLVPEANCAEAADSALADQVELIQVSTMTDAVQALRALNRHDDAAITRCSSS